MMSRNKSFLLALAVALVALAVVTVTWQAIAAPAPFEPEQASSVAQSGTFFFPLVFRSSALPGSLGFIQHAGQLLDYNGAETCQQCHADKVTQFGTSNHYLWQGKFGVINDFCVYPDINFGPAKLTTVFGSQVDGGCATCHAGMGEWPTANNPENADCLTCHADEYRRTLVQFGEGWRFAPDRAAMPATISIQKEPTRYACLTCHAYAGGGCNNKRGDISDTLINPSRDLDVHMGSGMTCVDCHLSEDHRIAGRGVDLRIDEGVPMRACTDCHNPTADHNEEVVHHLNKVACQSCHIPAYARAVSTDMLRDFRTTEVNARGLYEPVIQRGMNVTPVYAFWNGGSEFYEFRDPAVPEQALALPLGDINSGKLYPFRLHKAIQPQDVLTQALLPVKAGILFQTGNVDQAIRVGAQETGFSLAQGYTFVNTQRWMGLYHEMPPAEQALDCASCHVATDRVNFAALGYTPRTTRNGSPLCSSCHEPKEPFGFNALHDKHVKDKGVACAECHTFVR